MPIYLEPKLTLFLRGEKGRDLVLSLPVQTKRLSSLLFHAMGDNLCSSSKISETVPGK